MQALSGGASVGWRVILPVVCLLAAGDIRPSEARQTPGGPMPEAGPAPDAAGPPVRIDAVVTDAAGRRVLTLVPGDFEVKVNGAAQPLTGLEVRTPPRPRVFAFFLDEYHVSPGAPAERVRESLTRFVDTHVRATDRVVLFKPLEPVRSLSFTTDRQQLRDAIQSFKGRKGDLAPRTPFEEQFIGHAPAAIASARAQIVTVALVELAVQLGELQAERAALVLVSEGFQRGVQGMARRQGRLPDLHGLVRAASRFNFSVYALSPADVPDDAPDGATLGWLAHQTGGVSVDAAGRLDEGLGQLASDMEAYYELLLPPPANDGRFRRVEVATKKAGLNVRARPGYWAPLSSEVQALLSRTSTSLLTAPRRSLRRSPLIDAWVGLRPIPEGKLALVFSWVPTPRASTAKPPPMPSELHVTARSESGDVLFEGNVARAGKPDAIDVARFAVPGGRVELDISVLTEDGKALDTDVRDVYVPLLTGATSLALLPPEVLRARTVPEYRRIVEDAAAVPTPERAFSRGDRLVIRTPVWQAEGRDVEVTARMLNRRGQPMRALDPLPATSDHVAAFDLPLAWLAPGNYYIEVTARDGERVVGERILVRISQ